MKKLLILLLFVLAIPSVQVRGQKKYREPRERKERTTREPRQRKERTERAPKEKREKTSADVPRNNKGRIARSSKALREFKKQTGYPHGRKGYVIDHIKPLKEGGSDTPDNMQWQTIEDAKAKDKTE